MQMGLHVPLATVPVLAQAVVATTCPTAAPTSLPAGQPQPSSVSPVSHDCRRAVLRKGSLPGVTVLYRPDRNGVISPHPVYSGPSIHQIRPAQTLSDWLREPTVLLIPTAGIPLS